jgi:hypothetical protein
VNQRWHHKRDSYRPAGEVIDPRRYEVATIADDTTAKAFVLQHHYAGTFPAARFRYGLYEVGNGQESQTGPVRVEGGPHREDERRTAHQLRGIARAKAKSCTQHAVRRVAGDLRLENPLVRTADNRGKERTDSVDDRRLVGVAVFSVPCNNATLTNVFPCDALAATELGRFVLLDRVPGNGETWFLARCFELLKRQGIAGVVSFSDDQARTTADGRTVFGGHVGTIYQASNAIYLGRGTARNLRLLPDATVLSDRAIAKLKSHHRGWESVARKLIGIGGVDWAVRCPIRVGGEVARLTRLQRHPGNHKYAFAIDRRMRKHLPPSRDYPKLQRRAA